ncbi:hypothetical protein KSS87_022799 [Heliosperma pusillum]|nr:hypothetical protein KSS87_022799 [Heliosperma pusillum]
MACFYCCHILADIGPHKLEDKYSHWTLSTLHLFRSSIAAVYVPQGRDWNVGGFRSSDWLELPGAIILIIVVAPTLVVQVRGSALGAAVCLVIGCYLLQEHIRASGGFKKSFTKAKGLSNTLGIVLLLAYPLWYFVVSFL